MSSLCKMSLAAALFLAATPAVAHDWYPIECCHGMDCAPVEKVDMPSGPGVTGLLSSPAHAAPLGEMVVTTKHGSVAVPVNFPRRESKDHRMHACMRPTQGGAMRLICIFLPPAM